MKKLLFALVGIIVLLLVAVFVGPSLIDLRPRIASAVRDATGREFRIDGPLKISLLPRISIAASGIHLANAPGAAAPEMLSIDSFSLQAELWPLIGKRLVIDSLEIAHPVANLEVDKSGRANWAFGAGNNPEAPPASKSSAQGGSTLGALQVRALKLDQGQFSYRNAATGQVLEAKDVALTEAVAGVDAPLTLQGRMILNGEPVVTNFAVDSPDKLSRGQQAKLDLALDTKRVTAKFGGTAQQQPVPGLNGIFDLDIPSVGQLAAWLGAPLGAGRPDPGPLKFHATFVSDGAKVALKEATITGKAIEAAAQASFDGGSKPATFDAKIDVKQADLNAYLPPAAPKQAAATPAPQQPSPSSGWSTEPFDLAPLGIANGKAEVTLAAVRYRDLDISRGAAKLTLANRVLNFTIDKLVVAQGSIDGITTIDASSGTAQLNEHIVIAGVEARPVLETFAGSDRLGGTIAFDTTVKGSGKNQQELISSLDGDGRFKVTNGAIYGINIAQTLRKVGTLGFGNSETEKTDFAELSGSYTIKSGVIDNRDLKLLAPVLRLTGGGTVPMPPRTIDYAVEAKLVATIEGQGGKDALAGLPIPIKITGSWSNPSYQVDWSSVFKNMAADPERLKALPSDLAKSAKDLGVSLPASGGLGGVGLPGNVKPIPGMPQSLLPGASPSPSGETQKSAPSSPLQLPSGLLGR